MTVGFTDWISTRGPSASAVFKTNVDAKAITKQIQALLSPVCMVWLIRCHGRFRNIHACQTFDEKPGTVFGHCKTQFEIGITFLDFRQLRVKKKRRIGQPQPLLWIAAQILRNVACLFRSVHFYENSGFYWILKVHCKANQLRSIEQFTRKNRVESAGEIRRITGNESQGALTI